MRRARWLPVVVLLALAMGAWPDETASPTMPRSECETILNDFEQKADARVEQQRQEDALTLSQLENRFNERLTQLTETYETKLRQQGDAFEARLREEVRGAVDKATAAMQAKLKEVGFWRGFWRIAALVLGAAAAGEAVALVAGGGR